MKITTLYDIAENDNILIENFRMKENKSLAVYIDGNFAIAMDDSKINNTSELKTALAHEIGHCATCSFYNQYSTFDIRSKHEFTANKWAVENLMPKEEFISAIKNGYSEIWQLAELFEVEEWLVKKALYIYFDMQQYL